MYDLKVLLISRYMTVHGEINQVFDMQREKTLCNLINRLSQPKKDNSFLLALNIQLSIGNQKIITSVIKVRILPCIVKWG